MYRHFNLTPIYFHSTRAIHGPKKDHNILTNSDIASKRKGKFSLILLLFFNKRFDLFGGYFNLCFKIEA